ncbi:MAG: TonB-dependent receptor domain-containing protein [Bryobacteraceae bacterium]
MNEFSFGRSLQHKIFLFLDQNGSPVDGSGMLQKFGMTNLGGRKAPDVKGGAPFIEMQTLGEQTGVLAGSFSPFPANLVGTFTMGGVSESHETFTYQVRNNLSWHRNRHLIKMGIEVRKQRPNSLSVPGDAWGRYRFTGNFSGYDFADMLLGLPFSTTIATARPLLQDRQWEVGFFVQDDWRVTSNLTVTGGVRFTHYGVPRDDSGLYYNFDLQNLRIVVPDQAAQAKTSPAYPKTIPIVTAAEAGFPSRLANFKFLLWEPRLGIAWRPIGPKFVVRAGYGIYNVPYQPPAGGGGLSGRTGGPFALTENFTPNQIVNGQPSFTLSSPFPGGGGAVGLQGVTYLPVDLRANNWPYDQQWNLTLERELPYAMAARISYVGSKGTHWPYTVNLQVPRPSTIPFTPARRPYGPNVFSSIGMQTLGGNSTYHGLELELTRQFSRGLYIRSWYEWKKSLNDVNGGLFGSVSGDGLEDPGDRLREKGWQDGVVPHKARLAAVYTLPVGRGQQFLATAPVLVNHLLGSWTVAANFNFLTGQRYTPTFSGVDTANVGRSSGRPDQLCNPNGFGSTPGRLWNPACFAVPPSGRYGSTSRGMLAGPVVWNTQLNVFKQWWLTGKENGPYFKTEMYVDNLFNHANTTGPNSLDIRSPQFGFFRYNGQYRTIYLRLRVGF